MKKKLLIVVPTLQAGGQERVATNMAKILASDFSVTLAIFDGRNPAYSVDCDLIDLHMPTVRGRIKKVKNALQRTSALGKLRRDRKIDICVSFGPTANLVNVLSRGYGKTVVRISSYWDCRDSMLNRFTYHRCDRIICCSELIRSELPKAFHIPKHRTYTLYNPLDLEAIEASGGIPVNDYSFSSHTIISHGRLDEIKNWPRLIKAFSLVKEKLPDAQLLIIGEGDMRGKLEELISAYGLERDVTLLGYRENPFAYLAKASLYVLPSYTEGFPNSLAEAMCFLPVVAADCKSGPREILSDDPIDRVAAGWEESNYGILVQPAADQVFHREITEDDKVLTDAMLAVLTDPERTERMKSAAQQRVKEFSCERYREKLAELLEGF